MSATAAVLVTKASRPLRRLLTPVEWVVLEDLALDATHDGDGSPVAATSARQVAGHLGISPGSVAKALGRLRSLGLVTHHRRPGPEGRFGLSVYALAPVPGLKVVGVSGSGSDRPCADSPRAGSPCVPSPRVADPHMVDAYVGAGTSSISQPKASRRQRRAALLAADGDVQLDLLTPVAGPPTPGRPSTQSLSS